ncbi:MAG: PilZ domain-containing protein [Anaeromyxobacter sp.]
MDENERARRRFTRIKFDRPAVLDVSGRRHEGTLVDLSLKGALIELEGEPAGLTAGVTCSLTVPLDDVGEARIRMDGEIAHRHERRVGFRCDELDLESAEHLRRFVEVNVADEAVLLRELWELVAERDW